MNNLIEALIENMEKVIVGKRSVLEHILVALLSDGHVLIEDVPGVGKTQIVATLARSVNGVFNRVQFTPDLMPSDIMGFSMFNPGTREFEYREGATMCNFLLADEINRTSPKTQSSLLECMEEGQVTVDGTTRKLGKPFLVLATQNPVETRGTFPLPEAQLDRFFMRLKMGYPSQQEGIEILQRFKGHNPETQLETVASGEAVLEAQASISAVKVSAALEQYIVEIIEQTRHDDKILLGVSPRGSIALMRAAQVNAIFENRDFVLPDDVKKVAIPVLAHRLLLKGHAISGGTENAENAIHEILKRAPVPTEEF